MIAPIRQSDPETVEVRRRMKRARRVVASTLFSAPAPAQAPAPPIPAWQAWLFAGWVVVVAVAYCTSMLGLW